MLYEVITSLLSRYINSAGIIVDDTLLSPLYFSDLPSETLQKRYLTEELGLKSLYVVPRFEPRTRRVICLVNYRITSYNVCYTKLLRHL